MTCHILGVPGGGQERFRAWGHQVAANLEPQARPSEESRSRSAELALTRYLLDLVVRRRDDPDTSLLSDMVATEEEGGPAERREVSAPPCCSWSPGSTRRST